MKVEATLGFGGNLGDPVLAFAGVLGRLRAHAAIEVKAVSSVWRTAPWGKLDQPEFRNMAVLLESTLSADELLDLCLAIERESGRERLERWGPRTLDIDILTYGGQTIDRPGLQIPHPRITERAFVLAPLAEIAPTKLVAGRSVVELLAAIASEDVRQDVEETGRLQALLGA
ncbi:2-amino-4-hydroxy-6-hydroxymethyldihydropteridine diphosphokinase [Bosea sp. (in: a-proteobacteria)]|uniref:2-amino-4-hydroxy-6- hydroxymethyldihydropteridine diphosphokinase n=1 Tax=Bosea sp. (in: a-proteobacteria) TaxID=1871050 RepID=UPI002FC60501